MEFFNSAVGVLQTLVVALGAGLGTLTLRMKACFKKLFLNWYMAKR